MDPRTSAARVAPLEDDSDSRVAVVESLTPEERALLAKIDARTEAEREVRRKAAELRILEYLGDAAMVTPEEERAILASWDRDR